MKAELRRLLTDVSQRHWLASWTKSFSPLCVGFHAGKRGTPVQRTGG
jgi:hypothetical protein